jgi:hypothetical protein
VSKRDVLARIADSVIQRVLRELPNGLPVEEALKTAYPFADDPSGAEVWDEALMRNADIISQVSARRQRQRNWRPLPSD